MKKLFSLFLIIAVCSSLLAVNVNAAELLPLETFTLTDESPELAGWGDQSNADSKVEITADPNDAENSVLALTHNPTLETGGGAVAVKSFAAPSSGEVLWMFDIMFRLQESRVYIELGVNGRRSSQFYTTEGFGIPNTWYSVIVHMEEGSLTANVYKKVKDSTDDYVKLSTLTTSTHGLVGAKFYTIKGKKSSEGNPDVVYIDNVRVLSGLYTEDMAFALDSEPISSTSDITSGGTVTASYNLMNADLDEDSEVLAPEYNQILPVLVAFDENGKMLDCVSYSTELALLDNPVSLSLDVSDFYEELSRGTLRLYVWDSIASLQTLMDEVVLSAE